MLMSLGPVVFDLVNNLLETGAESTAAFAKHEVVGGAPLWEAMGEDEARFTLSGVLHPEHFGGLENLPKLEKARIAQTPMPLMRGDFRPLGWVVIENLRSDSAYLNHRGVGREIRFEVDLLSVGNPGLGMASSILRLFA